MSDYDQLFCIKLAKAVRKHPCLYNYNLPTYSSKAALEAAWVDVAKEVGTGVAKCKDKWRNIRTVYSRNLKRAGNRTRRPYYLKGLLQFLAPFVNTSRSFKKKPQIEHEENNEAETENENIEMEPLVLEDDDETVNDLMPQVGTEVNPSPSVASDSYNCLQYIPASNIIMNHATNDVPSKDNEVDENTYNSRKMFLLSLLSDVGTMTDFQFRKFRVMALSSVDQSLASGPEPSIHERRSSSSKIGMDLQNHLVRHIQEPEEIVKTEPTLQESHLPDQESVAANESPRVDRINKNDACSYFGKYIAEEIRLLPIKRRMMVQKEIHDSISKALIDMNSAI